MRNLKILAGGAAAAWLFFKAIGLAETGMTRLLMALYGYDPGRAAARAPVAVLAAACILIGLTAQLWLLRQENEDCKHSAEKQCRDQTVAGSREQDARRGA